MLLHLGGCIGMGLSYSDLAAMIGFLGSMRQGFLPTGLR